MRALTIRQHGRLDAERPACRNAAGGLATWADPQATIRHLRASGAGAGASPPGLLCAEPSVHALNGTAVDAERLPCDISSLCRAQERTGSAEFLWRSQPSDRDVACRCLQVRVELART